METVIEARDLVKKYHDTRVVDGVKLTVNKGECFGVVGPAGSGKSTLLRLMYCNAPVTSGELFVMGLNVKTNHSTIRARIAVVQEEPGLDVDLSVFENLQLYARCYSVPSNKAKSRAMNALRALHLDDFGHRLVSNLTLADRKRVALSRLMMTDPEIVFLDEPTAGLQSPLKKLVWTFLGSLKERGKTIVISSSSPQEVESLCDRVLLVDKGHAVAQDKIEELITQHVGRDVVEFNVTAADLSYYLGKIKDKYSYQVYQDTIRLYLRPNQAPRDVISEITSEGITIRRASIEDVFLKLAGQSLASDGTSDRA